MTTTKKDDKAAEKEAAAQEKKDTADAVDQAIEFLNKHNQKDLAQAVQKAAKK